MQPNIKGLGADAPETVGFLVVNSAQVTPSNPRRPVSSSVPYRPSVGELTASIAAHFRSEKNRAFWNYI